MAETFPFFLFHFTRKRYRNVGRLRIFVTGGELSRPE